MKTAIVFIIVIAVLVVSVLIVTGRKDNSSKDSYRLNDSNKLTSTDKQILQSFNFNEDEFSVSFSSLLKEYLLFTKTGIVTDRFDPISIFVPYKNIEKVTKEFCEAGGPVGKLFYSDSFMITVKTNIEKQGTLINGFEKNQYMDMEKLKGAVEFDSGIIVMESVSDEMMIELEKTFISNGVTVEEIPCNPA